MPYRARLQSLAHRASVVAFALLLAACGGGGGSGGGGVAAGGGGGLAATVNNPMPLAVGDRWVYRYSDGSHELVAVESTRSVQGMQAAVVATTALQQGGAREETLLARIADGVLELPDTGDPVSVALGNFSVLPLPLQVGPQVTVLDRSVVQGYDFDGDGRPDAMTLRVDREVQAIESVTVPAGTFAGSAKVRTVVRLSATLSSTGAVVSTVATGHEWYAPDVGLVRESVVTEGSVGSATQVRELTAYRVAGRRSDVLGPAVANRMPADGSTSGVLHNVRVVFDEPPDATTVLAGGIAVLGADGQPLVTTLRQLSGTEFDIAFASSPPTGTYTVRVAATVADLLGNTRPVQQWAWAVDRSAPGVARSTPAQNAVDVALDTSVEVVFDEPINTTTANANSIQLRDRFSATLAATVTVVDSRTVRVTPVAALKPGETYVLLLSPTLADVQGNNSPWTELRFSTVQGLFGYPVRQAGDIGRGLALADFTGDGLVDVLDLPNSWTEAVRLHPRRAAGGLDAPRLLPLPDSARCGAAGLMRAADMDGDGRVDLVVTRAGQDCGVQVLRQEADGSLSLLATLPVSDASRVALADLNGDGRVDVVVSAGFDQTLTVWLQTGAGTFGAGRVYASIASARGGLAVGDVTGDGRPDIVVSAGQFDLDRALTILPQQADGSFGAPVSRALAGGSGSTPLALADIDGDGRLDIVLPAPGSGGFWVLRQASNGTLHTPVAIAGSDTAADLAVADFNADGRPDIAFVFDSFASPVRVHLQAADGSFDAGRNYAGPDGLLPTPLLGVADITGDGRVDIVLSGLYLLPRLGAATPQGGLAAPGSRTLRSLLCAVSACPR